ncbi:BMP family ABC transporter substrate-binding protein [Anaerovorax odorimutans]|uniref:BMP family ABC transporter substrate-binding protein n=1 Tax=Anaerovorax odorimutans TaxID=109327 RepID=UPI0004151335|nr:BMP family ABC transporter substrate-binding protein [Anaerovorax odorimutans]
MKKFLAVVLILVLAMTAMTGCGDNKSDKTKDDSKAGEPELTVGFIYVGPVDDGGFTESHDKGRLAIEKEFGDRVKCLKIENVAETVEDVVSAGETLVDQGAQLIFSVSYGFMDGTEALAKEFPDVKFMHFSGTKSNNTNFGNYMGAMEQPRYLSGIVAGMKTETNKIGYVAAYPIPEVAIGINAFTLGVQSVNPDATVTVVMTNSWYDPALEKASAVSLLEQGCDVIAQHCDTAGPQIAAQEAGKWAIGYNSDTRDQAPKAFMTAPLWDNATFYTGRVQAVLDGTWEPGVYYGDMSDGYVTLAPLSDVAPEGAKAKIKEVEDKFLAGEPVFVGPIKKQDGTIAVPEGESLKTKDEIWAMDYLVEGVIGNYNIKND